MGPVGKSSSLRADKNATSRESFITALDPELRQELSDSSRNGTPRASTLQFDTGHEFEKGIAEVEAWEKMQEEEELEKLRSKVFHEQFELQRRLQIEEEMKKQMDTIRASVHRPATVHMARSKSVEELASANLPLPRGLKFKPLSIGPNDASSDTQSQSKSKEMKSKQSSKLNTEAELKKSSNSILPRNLLEATQSIEQLEKASPKLLQSMTFDLEVLLGNKSAAGANKAAALTMKLMEKDNQKTTTVNTSYSHTRHMVPENVLAKERGIDVGKPGSRFGGGKGGRPIAPRQAEDLLHAGSQSTPVTRPDSPDASVSSSVAGTAVDDSSYVGPTDSVTGKLLGLPGGLAMTVKETEKYFGEQARVNFADRYHWIGEQRKITNFNNVPAINAKDQLVKAGTQRTLIFEQRGAFGSGAMAADQPFAPIRTFHTLNGCHQNATGATGMSALAATSPIKGSSVYGNTLAMTAQNTLGNNTGNSTQAAVSISALRGASVEGAGGLFSRGGKGAGADTFYVNQNKQEQLSNTLTLPLSPVSTPVTGQRSTAAASKIIPEPMHISTTDKIVSTKESEEAHHLRNTSKALRGNSTHVAVFPHVQKVDEKLQAKLQEFDILLEGTDFISKHLSDHQQVLKAEDLVDHFTEGVRKRDYSCLGAVKNGPYAYVSVHAPMIPVKRPEEDEATMNARKNKNKGPTAKQILELTEEQDQAVMEEEMYGIALQRKIFIEGNHESIPGYVISDASVNSTTHVDDAGIPISPRSAYIDACFRDGLNPRPSLVLRKGLTKKLDLSHQGIGDKLGSVLAECILNLPYLQSLNVSDNRLTDTSLGPIMQALVQMPNILHVDLSNNVMDDIASNTLSTYLGTATCPLVKLVMRNADIDDFECAHFVTALKDNVQTKLEELDMMKNLLGSAEQLNVVMPEMTTAGEAFAELIESETCKLNRLELGWNMIRGDSAIAFAEAFAKNHTLTYLDLSYNAFGKEAGREMGRALLTNKTLTYLDLSSNGLDGTAIMCISVALIENKIMRKIVLDGNPIGKLGAKAIMQVPTMLGSRVKVSVSKCNIAIPADKGSGSTIPFDFDNLLRSYDLNMSDAYERAQAFMLLYLIACHHTYVLAKWDWEESRGAVKSMDLTPFLNPDKQEFFTAKQKRIETALETALRAASDVNLAIQFFNEIDVDGSGELDRSEFKRLMDRIGIELDNERLEDVFDTYDTDQGGSIGVEEFLVFLNRQKAETESRLYDLTQTPAFCERKDLEFNKKDNIVQFGDKAEDGFKIVVSEISMAEKKFQAKRRYIPPATGRLLINIEDSFKRKPIFRTITNADKDFIEDVAAGVTDSISMTTYGVSNSKLRLDEALSLYHTLSQENGSKLYILAKILPQLSNVSDARLLVTKVLKNDRQDMMALKQTLGVAVRPLLGMCTGYYELDLAENLDRLCLLRLLEMSSNRAALLRNAKKHPLSSKGARSFDISQKRNNGSCFRNETFKGKPCVIDTNFATPLPRSGILTFDFSGGEGPKTDDMLCSDQRVVKILHSLHLLPTRACGAAMKKLNRYAHLTTLTMKGDGKTIYEPSFERASAIGDHMAAFYNNIHERITELEEAGENEDILIRVPLRADAFEKNKHEDVCDKVFGGTYYMNWNVDPCYGLGSLNVHSHAKHDLDCAGSVAGSIDSMEYPNGLAVGSMDLASIASSLDDMQEVNAQVLLEAARSKTQAEAAVPKEIIPERWIVRISNMSCKNLPNMDGQRQSAVAGGSNPAAKQTDKKTSDQAGASTDVRLKADPYLMFILGDEKLCTRYISNEMNPSWNKSNYNPEVKQYDDAIIQFHSITETDYIDLKWDPSPAGSLSLMVKVMDHDIHFAPETIGKLNIDLNEHKNTLEASATSCLNDVAIELTFKLPVTKGSKHAIPTISFDIMLLETSKENKITGHGCKLFNGKDPLGIDNQDENKADTGIAADFDDLEEGSSVLGDSLSVDLDGDNGSHGEGPQEGKKRKILPKLAPYAIHINLDQNHAMDKFSIKYRNIMLSSDISTRAKAIRVVEVVDDALCKLWILCRHVALVMEVFQFLGSQPRTTHFGSYRSDLCCLLYERIVDPHNFELVLRVLEPFEVATIICRIGWLSFYNIMKPEGGIQLNLGRYEERIIAKMLCVLAITEPGNNWTQYSFRWKAEDDCVPGWELTDGWVKQDGNDEGMPNRGILTLTYYSGEGKRLQGCKPNIGLRKALMYLTYLSEHDVRLEEDWGVPLTKGLRKEMYEKGANYIVNYPGVFKQYAFVDNGRY